MLHTAGVDAGRGPVVEDWRERVERPLPPILAAALTDLQEHGYHGTTVRNISARVGLTMPSLYYHYGNKEGILFALLDIAMDDLLARIADGLEEAGDEPQARFVNFVTAVSLHNTRCRDLAKLHDEYRVLGPDLQSRYVSKRNTVDTTLAQILEEGARVGVFRQEDPQFAMRLVLGMCNGIVDWYRPGGRLTPEEIADGYADRALRVVVLPGSAPDVREDR